MKARHLSQLLGSALVTVIALLHPGSASASLVSVDLNPGDGLLTLDTDTSLKWLDLTQTAGLGDLSGQFGAGQAFAGYRYATMTEVTTLFSHAGLPLGHSYAYAAAQNLFSLIGALDSTDFSYQSFNTSTGAYETVHVTLHASEGITGTPFVLGGSINAGWKTAYDPISCGPLGPCYVRAADAGGFTGGPTLGSWLVQTPVPAPATAMLMLAGMGLLGFALRRR